MTPTFDANQPQLYFLFYKRLLKNSKLDGQTQHIICYNALHNSQWKWRPEKLDFKNVDEVGDSHIWQNQQTGQFYRGKQQLPAFRPLEEVILAHLIKHPCERQTFSQIIAVGWHEEERDGVSNECVYQVIAGIRKKIEVEPGTPRYLLNWRGRPEGGYLFYPNGCPPSE